MPFDPDTHSWDLDEAAYAASLARSRLYQPWFRPVYEGFEHLRAPGGVMLVANHGLFAQEVAPLLIGANDEAGRPIRALGDRVLFATALQRALMARRGAAEGTPAVAHRLLSRGEIVYVCPGGAREGLADAKDRYRLFWEEHYGFVRSAIRASARIVPMAILGHDETYAQLRTASQVDRTAVGRLIRATLGPKYVTPMYVGLGVLPLPQRFYFRVGPAIAVPDDPELATHEPTVQALHAQAKRAVEGLLVEAQVARAQRIAALPPTERWIEERLLDVVR